MAQQRYNYILRHGEQSAAQGQQAVRPPQQGGRRLKKPRKKGPGLRVYDGGFDMVFFIIVIVLLAFGVVMMFSASYVAGLDLKKPDGYHYVRKQSWAAVGGIVVMVGMSIWDYHFLMNRKVVLFGFVFSMGLMLAVWTPLGYSVAGAHRWIKISSSGSTLLQPSEVMKAVLIVFLAYLIVNNEKRLHSFRKGIVPLIVVIGIVSVNMVLQRHISGLLIIVALSVCIIFISGVPRKQFCQLMAFFAVLGGLGVIALTVYSKLRGEGGGFSYIADRFIGMKEAREGIITTESWQAVQSLIAIGSGGWFGLGFGESRQKYAWLPESQNDFILPIIIEELGFLGGIVVVILFGLFIYRGFYIAKKAPDKFGMLITAGITFQIGLQAILNIGVACNAIPNTGISLPFFSYGGTALVIQLAEMGVILAVSRQCEI